MLTAVFVKRILTLINQIQHAVDTTLPLRDKQLLKAALKCIKSFGTISGRSLNIDKKECILLCDLKGTENTIHGTTIEAINAMSTPEFFTRAYLGQ